MDVELRNATYAAFVDLGRAPTAAEVAAGRGATREDVVAGWRELHDAHALVLNPATDELRMANPFSAVPTAYRVHACGRWWYANCAWDAFGICAALHADDRLAPDWRPHTREQNEAILDRLGLTGEFWRLA